MIEVARDYEGLEIAARELLEEELHAPDDVRAQESAEKAANREAALKTLRDRRTISPGYYDRALYLFKLDRSMGVVQFRANELMSTELEGVLLVRRVKQRFLDEHPQCPGCGAMQLYQLAPKCRKCGKTLRETK